MWQPQRAFARASDPVVGSGSAGGTPTLDPPAAAGGSADRPAGLVLLGAIAVLAVLALAASLFGRLHGLMIEDDAFIFARYANNLLHHHILGWNPSGPHTYGTTSLLYVPLVGLVRLAAGDAPARVVVLSSLACGIAFVILMVMLIALLVRRSGLAASPRARAALAVLLLVPAAWSAESLTAHFVTGMDTMFALAALTAVILATAAFEAHPSTRRGTWFALATGGAFFARADLVAFSLPLLVAIGLRPPPGTSRTAALRCVVGSLAVTGAGCGLAWAYFGTAVPLSFYVKGLVRYGGDLEASYASVPGEQLRIYARFYGLWALVVAARLGRDVLRRRWSFSAIELALLAGTIGFIVYYRTFVLQVMPHYQRFYYPTLPAIVFLAARSALLMGSDPGLARRRGIAWIAARSRAAALARGAAAVAIVVPLWGTLQRAIDRARAQPPFYELEASDNLAGFVPRNWFHLEEFATLPDDVVIAATEIGVPGVVFPEKTIVDLSGLNDPRFARNGLDPQLLFGAEPPDLIYMPHPDYRIMTQRILTNPTFGREYDYYSGRTLRTVLGLALRKTSPHYEAMSERLYSGDGRRTRVR